MTCKASGIITILSTEMSCFTVFLMAVNRYVTIQGTFKIVETRPLIWIIITLTALIICSAVAWLHIWLAEIDNSVCLLLSVSSKSEVGSFYTLVIFISVNFVLFICTSVLGVRTIHEISTTRKKSGRKIKAQDISLNVRLSLVIFTNILSWIVVTVFLLLSLVGVPIQPKMNAYVAVLVLPLNSAINPFLYTFSSQTFFSFMKKYL